MSLPEGRRPGALRRAGGLLRQHRFGRLLVVGFANTAFGYLLFALCFFLTGNHDVAVAAATAIGVVFNFFTTGRLVFGNRGIWAIIPFVLGYAVTLGFNIALLNLLVRAGLHPPLAQAASLPFVVVLTYVINARFVFRRTETV